MKSLILSSAARTVVPLLLLFSVFAFLRGHNEPGGGFIGGLVAVGAIGLWVLAEGVKPVQRTLRVSPRALIAAGLFIAIFSSLIGPLVGKPFFQGVWGTVPTPLGDVKLGTPLLFDLGVYLVVMGALFTVIFVLAEEEGE